MNVVGLFNITTRENVTRRLSSRFSLLIKIPQGAHEESEFDRYRWGEFLIAICQRKMRVVNVQNNEFSLNYRKQKRVSYLYICKSSSFHNTYLIQHLTKRTWVWPFTQHIIQEPNEITRLKRLIWVFTGFVPIWTKGNMCPLIFFW